MGALSTIAISWSESRRFMASDRIRAPLMVIHGANDPRVPIGEADRLSGLAGARRAGHLLCDSKTQGMGS